jgi:hypothetical protein
MKTIEQTAQGFVRGFEKFTGNAEGDATIRIDGMDFVDQMRAVLQDSKWSRSEQRQIIDLAFQTMLERDYFIIGGEA